MHTLTNMSDAGSSIVELSPADLDAVGGGFVPLAVAAGVVVGAAIRAAAVVGAACTGLVVGDYIRNGDKSLAHQVLGI